MILTKLCYTALREKIKSKECLNLNDFCKSAGINPSTFSRKLNAKYPFTQDEMYDIMDLLDIDYADMAYYFPNRTPEERKYTRRRKFNDTSENIVFVSPKDNSLIGITQKNTYSENCLIKCIDFNIYNFINGNFTSENNVGKSHCEITGENRNKLKIIDLGIEKINKNSGYGSLLLTQIIQSAQELRCEYIIGDIYIKDIETLDLKSRLYHFYEKFGFEIDDGNIRLKLN